MALSFSSTIFPKRSSTMQIGGIHRRSRIIKCETSKEPNRSPKLGIGSPIIIIEAPKVIKTADSMPCLIANSGLVKPGDVGRIVSRKPMDVWAVRLSVGTYLLDGKYFTPLELDEEARTG